MDSQSSSGFITDVSHIDQGYSDISEIASTRQSTLYRAKHHGRWVVLKALPKDLQGDVTLTTKLEKEFSTYTEMNHPNVVTTYSFTDVDGVGKCIVLEYVDGVTLNEYLATPRSRDERRRMAQEILKAMDYFHSKQIIHRDLKPKNIMVTRTGNNVKVIDFGLADADNYAIFKMPAGTREYSAPEQCDPNAQIDQRADIFSFGKILQQLLPEYANVAKRCTSPDREDRYFSAKEVDQALTNAANWHRARRVVIGVAAVLLTIGIGATIVTTHARQETTPETEPETEIAVAKETTPTDTLNDAKEDASAPKPKTEEPPKVNVREKASPTPSSAVPPDLANFMERKKLVDEATQRYLAMQDSMMSNIMGQVASKNPRTSSEATLEYYTIIQTHNIKLYEGLLASDFDREERMTIVNAYFMPQSAKIVIHQKDLYTKKYPETDSIDGLEEKQRKHDELANKANELFIKVSGGRL